MRIVCLLLSFLTFYSPAQANISKDLGAFFNKLGGSSNVSNPGAYKDQSAGYYTGGNLFARNQIHSSQLGTIQLPSYRAGCGGIDMFMGAFSHISSSRLIEALKAIGSNMGSYALLLAIETMSPQVKNIITELNDLVQKINQSNINSCEIAATTLGAVWPKSDAAQNHLCKMIGSEGKYGGFSDYAAARQGCGSEGKREGVLQAGASHPQFKDMLGTEFNLAWTAIQKNAFLKSNVKLAEFFMAISGTILSRRLQEGAYTLQTKPSLANNESLLSAILYGGEANVYHCQDKEVCLEIKESVLRIPPDKSLVSLVRDMLTGIETKIFQDIPLNAQEIGFLNSTRLPFYKILNVATAYRRGGSPIDILSYAEIGSIDILFQYISEILDVINDSLSHLKLFQVNDTHIKDFQKSLLNARRQVVERRMGSFKQIEQVISIVSKTELLEKSLMLKAGAMSRGDGS